MSETSEALRALIERASHAGPGPERLASVRARLESQLGPLDAPRPSPAGLGPTALGPKTVGAVAVLAVIGIALWLGTRSPSADQAAEPERAEGPQTGATLTPETEPTDGEPLLPSAPEPQEREPLAAEADGDEPASAPAVSPRAVRLAAPEPIEPAPVAGSASSLREEIALLDRALRASEAGDVVHARQALDEHRARFPSGTLSPERDRMLGELSERQIESPTAP